MPIRIRRVCRHCGQPVEQGADHFSQWFHSRGEGNTENSRKCEPFNPASTLAIPKIDVVKLGET